LPARKPKSSGQSSTTARAVVSELLTVLSSRPCYLCTSGVVTATGRRNFVPVRSRSALHLTVATSWSRSRGRDDGDRRIHGVSVYESPVQRRHQVCGRERGRGPPGRRGGGGRAR